MNPQEAKKLETQLISLLLSYISKKDTVIAGISGGPDSMFLLELLQQTPCKIVVAHVNHNLRKKDSELDEKFVINYCKNHELTLKIKNADIAALSKKSKKGIEETGRKVRYAFFTSLAKKYKASHITTAHHADDNLETIIMNLTRGASIQGMCGIEECSPLAKLKKTQLLRPLLSISKKQILAYLKLKKIKYRTDKSNENTIYKRNLVRAKIIPKLKKLNPSITETVAKNNKNLREINEFLEKKAQQWIKTNSLSKNHRKLKTTSFKKTHPALQKAIIRTLYLLHTGNTQNIETPHIEQVQKILIAQSGNLTKKLGKLTFYKKNNILEIKD